MIEGVRRFVVNLELHVVAAGVFVIPENIADRSGVGFTQAALVNRGIAEVPALIELQLLVAAFKVKVGVFRDLPFDERTNEQATAVTTIVAVEVNEAKRTAHPDPDPGKNLIRRLEEDRIQ